MAHELFEILVRLFLHRFQMFGVPFETAEFQRDFGAVLENLGDGRAVLFLQFVYKVLTGNHFVQCPRVGDDAVAELFHAVERFFEFDLGFFQKVCSFTEIPPIFCTDSASFRHCPNWLSADPSASYSREKSGWLKWKVFRVLQFRQYTFEFFFFAGFERGSVNFVQLKLVEIYALILFFPKAVNFAVGGECRSGRMRRGGFFAQGLIFAVAVEQNLCAAFFKSC